MDDLSFRRLVVHSLLLARFHKLHENYIIHPYTIHGIHCHSLVGVATCYKCFPSKVAQPTSTQRDSQEPWPNGFSCKQTLALELSHEFRPSLEGGRKLEVFFVESSELEGFGETFGASSSRLSNLDVNYGARSHGARCPKVPNRLMQRLHNTAHPS